MSGSEPTPDWTFSTSAYDERARRLEFTCALLRAGGLARGRAANILASELRGLAGEVEEDGDTSLTAIMSAVRELVIALGATEPERPCEMLMLDDNEVTRDLVVIALEAQGHSVRVAPDTDALQTMFERKRPNVIVTSGRFKSVKPEDLGRQLRNMLAGMAIPVVLFASETGPALEYLAKRVGADRFITKDQGITTLISEIDQLLEELIW